MLRERQEGRTATASVIGIAVRSSRAYRLRRCDRPPPVFFLLMPYHYPSHHSLTRSLTSQLPLLPSSPFIILIANDLTLMLTSLTDLPQNALIRMASDPCHADIMIPRSHSPLITCNRTKLETQISKRANIRFWSHWIDPLILHLQLSLRLIVTHSSSRISPKSFASLLYTFF